jgi:hypothetical protein
MNCPICNKEMITNETPGMLTCQRTLVKDEELGAEIESVHAIYFLNQDGHPILKTIEALPYVIQIHDDPKFHQTRISKLVKGYSPKAGQTAGLVTYGNERILCEDIILVPKAIDLQWDDPAAIKERVSMYILFS